MVTTKRQLIYQVAMVKKFIKMYTIDEPTLTELYLDLESIGGKILTSHLKAEKAKRRDTNGRH